MAEHTEGIVPAGSNGWFGPEDIAKRPALHSEDLYRRVFHGVAKQYLYNLHCLFSGKAVTLSEAHDRTLYLPYRLTAAELKRAREAGAVLWDIIVAQQLERTPLASAKGDRDFQRFLSAATKPKRRRAAR